MNERSGPTEFTTSSETRAKAFACFALLLVGVFLVAGHRIRLSEWHVEPGSNAALDEALSWRHGRLDIENNNYEVARVNGRRYNVTGLAFTILSVFAVMLTHIGGGPADTFFPPYFVILVAFPIPIAAFLAFRTVTRSSSWAAVLAGNLIIATSLLPVLAACQGGVHGASIYVINHALAVTGLLIVGADLLGPRRIWPAILGLALAAWSRQMTVFYALPILWLALRHNGSGSPSPDALGRRMRWVAAAGILVVAAVPMTLNLLKFGNPLDSGYSRIYEGRQDSIGRRGSENLFSLDYVRPNALAMNLAYPIWDVRRGELYANTANLDGGSIWLTTPILLGVATTARKWWKDLPRRALMISTIPVIIGLLLYHTTGAQGSGYYRYALDFIPIWLLVIAPYTLTPRGMACTLGCMAYSAVYFSLLPQ